jgi:hypothetical protein
MGYAVLESACRLERCAHIVGLHVVSFDHHEYVYLEDDAKDVSGLPTFLKEDAQDVKRLPTYLKEDAKDISRLPTFLKEDAKDVSGLPRFRDIAGGRVLIICRNPKELSVSTSINKNRDIF